MKTIAIKTKHNGTFVVDMTTADESVAVEDMEKGDVFQHDIYGPCLITDDEQYYAVFKPLRFKDFSLMGVTKARVSRLGKLVET